MFGELIVLLKFKRAQDIGMEFIALVLHLPHPYPKPEFQECLSTPQKHTAYYLLNTSQALLWSLKLHAKVDSRALNLKGQSPVLTSPLLQVQLGQIRPMFSAVSVLTLLQLHSYSYAGIAHPFSGISWDYLDRGSILFFLIGLLLAE